MTFSLAILAVVVFYTWAIEPIAPRWAAAVPTLAVIALSIWRALRSGEWGVRPSAFLPALLWAAAATAVATLAMYLAGSLLGTWHDRRDGWSRLAVLIPWGLGQQFALQTVFLREAQAALSKSSGIWLAALLFAALHLPNPFLTAATALGALAWCWLYDRHPNLLPLALSHAVVTLAILYAFDETVTGGLRVGAAYWSR
jgi:membrane protease YdiL (CAAX protease family)